MDLFQIGSLSAKVIDILHLPFEINTPILLGNSNIDHIKKTHPLAFLKCGNRITEIVNTPDYVRINPKD
ncbi:MAG: hypothetical protein E7191_07780 [Erysipelotrichaceae bacterium]|nr:hypothetical protein [Erysipelotrichaceae bacterium]